MQEYRVQKYGWKRQRFFVSQMDEYMYKPRESRFFNKSIVFCCTSHDLTAGAPWSVPLTSQPRNCALHLLAPRAILADLLAAGWCRGRRWVCYDPRSDGEGDREPAAVAVSAPISSSRRQPSTVLGACLHPSGRVGRQSGGKEVCGVSDSSVV